MHLFGETLLKWFKGTATYLKLGSTATSHSLASSNDLVISGKLEVDGLTYHDADVVHGDNVSLRMGTGEDVYIKWSTTQTKDCLLIGTGDTSKTLIITKKADTSFNFAHSDMTDPTLIVHSHNQATDEWISLSHDGTDGAILVGTGVIKFGTYTAGAAGDSTGYITIKDAAGNTRKLMVQA